MIFTTFFQLSLTQLLRKSIANGEESKCRKIFSYIKLFFAHLFSHVGLTALVVSSKWRQLW